MKTTLLAAALLTSGFMAQTTDSLPSAVYQKRPATAKDDGTRKSSQLLKGSTLDLAELEVHTSTLAPGKTNHTLQRHEDAEELVIVQAGTLMATVADSTKALGPSSMLLIEAGDNQQFRNASAAPVMYCVLKFKAKTPVDKPRGQAGGGSLLKDWQQLKVVKTEKGEKRAVFDQASTMFKRFEVHATTLNPGVASHPPHTHRAEEIIVLVSGSGEELIDGKPQKATVGDVILLRANVPHNFTNTGRTPCAYYAIQWHTDAE